MLIQMRRFSPRSGWADYVYEVYDLVVCRFFFQTTVPFATLLLRHGASWHILNGECRVRAMKL
jgi:hypothetical protein